MAKKKKARSRLDDTFLELPNADKGFHEKWYKGRSKLNIPHPFRAVCLGPPNTGKSFMAKYLLMHQDPPFEELKVIHCDPEYTKEYDDVKKNCEEGVVELMSEIPDPTAWEGEKKTLVILDDLEYKEASKDQKRCLDRLFGFVSTHKNISVILCAQDPFNVPPCVRRCANMFILWKSPDIDSMATCARKTGMKPNTFSGIFNSIMPNQRDCLWIDMTDKSPYPLRKNGTILLEKRKGIDSEKITADVEGLIEQM